MDTSDLDQQSDEILALESIFSPEELRRSDDGNSLTIAIPSFAAAQRLELAVHLPTNYPSAAPPVFELRCHPSDAVGAETTESIADNLAGLFCLGEVVIYAWTAWLQEEWQRIAPPEPPSPPSPRKLAAAVETNGQHDGAVNANSDGDVLGTTSGMNKLRIEVQTVHSPPIISGEPLMERKSTFQAHLAEVTDVAHVEAVIATLLENNKLRHATHPTIMAYRIERPDVPGTFRQDCDDDGEQAAGNRLLHLLQLCDARNVVIVVSRWFGGVLLGPSRFGLINKVARDLLEQCGYVHSKGSGGSGGGGKKGGK